MKNLNKVTLLGYVGQDPKITTIKDSNNKIATFSVATTSYWKDRGSGELKSSTEWHAIVVYNPLLIETCEKSVHKGIPVYVEGELKSRKWKNKEGVEVKVIEVILKNYQGQLIVLPKETKQEDLSNHFGSNTNETANFDDLNDDIPF